MKSLTSGNVKIALGTVRATRWRNFLTMLGVVIGVLSVVTIVSIGEGVKQQVGSQINRLGKDLITIRPGKLTENNPASTLNLLVNPNSVNALNQHDLDVVKATPHVKLAVPLSVVPGVVQVSGQPKDQISVIATTGGIPTVLNQNLAFGAFFTNDDLREPTAVIGANLAQSLFSSDVPLGYNFNFHGEKFIVRGVLNRFDSAPFSVDSDFNNTIFIPYDLARSLNHGNLPIYEILTKPTTQQQTAEVAQSLQKRLASAHGGQVDFSVLKQNQSLAVTNNILNLLTSLISGIAAISLFVGGIGIMNVMLVSVTERTHEIGIRKAIGATNRQILNQFLTESIVLSLVGGLLGLVLAGLLNIALRILTNLTPVISWQVMVVAVGVSLAVGVVFGITPALKAAHKDPINALRDE